MIAAETIALYMYTIRQVCVYKPRMGGKFTRLTFAKQKFSATIEKVQDGSLCFLHSCAVCSLQITSRRSEKSAMSHLCLEYTLCKVASLHETHKSRRTCWSDTHL